MPTRAETMPPCGPRGRLCGSPVPIFKPDAKSGSRAVGGKRRELEYSEDRGPKRQTIADHQAQAASQAPHSGLDRDHAICMCSRSRHEAENGKSCADRKGSPSYFREVLPTRCRCNPSGKVTRQQDQLRRATVPASPVTLSSARGSNCASPCQANSFRQCSRRGPLPNTPSDTSTSASGRSGLSLLRGGSLTPWPAKQRQTATVGQVTLRDWFFVSCDEGEPGDVDPGNPEVALGGIYISESFERQVVRTTRIVERLKRNLLRTIDGVDVWLSGRMDVESTVANGFSLKVVQQFCTGFPSMWKPFLERAVASGNHDIHKQGTQGAAVGQAVEIDKREEGVDQEVEINIRNEHVLQDVESESRDKGAVSQEVGIERRDAGIVAQEVGIERRDEGVAQELKTECRDEGACQQVEMPRREDSVVQEVEIEMREENVCQELQIDVSLVPANALEDKLDTELVKDATQTAAPCMTLRSSSSVARHSKPSVRMPNEIQGAVSSRPHRRRSSIIPPPAAAPVIPVSPDMVSKAFGLKTSRSGRLLVPPLAFWRNQAAVHDKDGGIIAIMDGFDREEDPDSGRYNFERPTEKKAVRLQKKLHKVVQQLQSPNVVRKRRR